jgi:lipoate-protein ligase A
MNIRCSVLNWRVIDTDLADPYFVTAADEALAVSIGKYNGIETLHFYRRNPPAVSLGYFTKVADDVDIAKCKELGIKILRRTSAGGSIYTDSDQLIYSLITRTPPGKNFEDTFQQLGEVLMNALEKIGIKAEYKPPNDLTINGRKISGSAQVKKWNVYLIHGTIIFALDNSILELVLKKHKPGYTSSLEVECGFKPDISKLKNAIIESFQEKFNVLINPGEFSDKEKEIINDLIVSKYSKESWIFKR